jgi:arginyl-tRNA synthetase
LARVLTTIESWGPAESEVVRQVRDAGIGAPTEAEAVPRSKVGDFRFDVGSAPLPAGICAALVDLPLVESVAYVPPRIYVRTTLAFLEEAVLGSVERAGTRYASLPPGSRDDLLITYSDPNANKPLHVGHLRNVFLGAGLAALHRRRGHSVRQEGTFGDWGVHMCQTLLSYLRQSPTREPDAGQRGDRFVGELYTRYHAGADVTADSAEARDLLRLLESGHALAATQRQLADWAIAGIATTYDRIGVGFDGLFREGDYLGAARGVLAHGLARGWLHRRDDGCVIYRGDATTSETVLARPDGTLLVYAQMLGVDTVRFADRPERIISIFGDQWEAAARAYKEIAIALQRPWAARYQPVFYGMVRMPEGNMRSRLGRAVLADAVIDRLTEALPERAAVALLKYHLLRRPRARTLVFDVTAILNRTLPMFTRVLAYSGPQLGVGEHRGSATAREAAALRRLLLSLNGLGPALDVAVERLDPSVVLQYVERVVATAEQIAPSVWTPRLRAAVATVVSQGLESVGITP